MTKWLVCLNTCHFTVNEAKVYNRKLTIKAVLILPMHRKWCLQAFLCDFLQSVTVPCCYTSQNAITYCPKMSLYVKRQDSLTGVTGTKALRNLSRFQHMWLWHCLLSGLELSGCQNSGNKKRSIVGCRFESSSRPQNIRFSSYQAGIFEVESMESHRNVPTFFAMSRNSS